MAMHKKLIDALSAEELIKEFEELGKRILVEHGYSDNWRGCTGADQKKMPEVAYYACQMLSHLERTRHWMQERTISADTLNMAVREAINAICQFAYIKNAEIGDNYLRGEKILMGARDGGKQRAKNQPERTGERDQRILNYANELLEKGNSRHSIASIIVNNMNILRKKYPDTSFPRTYKGIHEILKKTGFYKKTNAS
jgi:hypothetical protein